MKNRKGFCFARFFSNPISNLFAKNGYYTMQLFSTSTAENRIVAQAIPDRWVHDRQWLSSNYEHKQGIPSSTQAVYQMRQNASTWNIKTGWKNPRYLPIFLWMWQLPTSMVCQRVCCNSFVEHICYDLTYTSIEKWKMKVEQGQGSGKPPFPCPRINCGFYLPSLSGKVSLFGFSSALHLPSFWFSNFTETAAAVNTPAIPVSMPPKMPISCSFSCSYLLPEYRLVIPIVFNCLKHSYNNRYPVQVIHLPSLHLAALDAPLFVK